MNTKALQKQAAIQYEDLRDTILTLEAMEEDAKPAVSWGNLKKKLAEDV